MAEEKKSKPLSLTHPDLANQADGWDPSTITAGSKKKLNWVCKYGHKWSAVVQSRAEGRNCPICSRKQVLVGFNDLATTHPHIALEAFGWDPTTVTAGSSKRLKWKCKLGHTWETKVFERHQTGCAICSGRKVLAGFNDLATTHPEIAAQANGWDPRTIREKSGRKLLWKCELGHEWRSIVATRTQGKGCPYCSGQKVLRGFNDLLTQFPEVAMEAHGWDPTTVTSHSGKKQWWKCPEGHSWLATPNHRVTGSGCPSCSSTQYDPNLTGYLYFLKHDVWDLLQIGITNQPQKRLAKHQRLGWETIEVLEMDGLTARNWETNILKLLRSMNVDLGLQTRAGKFDGYSECWSKGKYSPSNLRELMNRVRDFENWTGHNLE